MGAGTLSLTIGLKAIEKELGAKISHIESRTQTDQEAHFRDYALDGYQLVFGHGFEYQESAKQRRIISLEFTGLFFFKF